MVYLQAAAHGVPTVATKNGGPVDIMATLHHGLVVDPTNSKQIADALINILTNAEVWDEMSHNGTPSHCTPFADCTLHGAFSSWAAQRRCRDLLIASMQCEQNA